MSFEFTCKLCEAKHYSNTKNEYGVTLLPDTITTQRNSKQEWFFCCVKCPEAKSVPTRLSTILWLHFTALWKWCVHRLKFTWNALTQQYRGQYGKDEVRVCLVRWT